MKKKKKKKKHKFMIDIIYILYITILHMLMSTGVARGQCKPMQTNTLTNSEAQQTCDCSKNLFSTRPLSTSASKTSNTEMSENLLSSFLMQLVVANMFSA